MSGGAVWHALEGKEGEMTDRQGGAKLMIGLGRAGLLLASAALLGAWLASARNAPILGFGEEHLFRDAGVLALLGIGFLIDGLIHRRGL